MDAYKTPESELIDDHNRPYKPVKGILVGLGYTIVLAMIASMILLFIFVVAFRLGQASPNLESEIANNSLFMLSDTILGSIVLFFGGRAAGKRTPGKELKFGVILAIITVIVYLIFMIATESFKTYPLIYNLATFVIAAIAIPYGAKSSSNK